MSDESKFTLYKTPSMRPMVVLKEIEANKAKLSGCVVPHDFSIRVERNERQPETDKESSAVFMDCYFRCSKCGGAVSGHDKSWYERGLKDGKI